MTLHHGARLQALAPELWGAEHDMFLPGGVHFRGRMTVIRKASGGLILHSPIPIDDALHEELAALGEVEQVVLPSAWHHVHATGAARRYPDASLCGPPALAKKRPTLAMSNLLEAGRLWGGDLEQHRIGGYPAVDEVVFFHAHSKSLIVTDYFFNIHDYRGWLTGLLLRVVGARRRFVQSRTWRLIVKDKASARASAQAVLSWPFERIVMAHGNVIEEDAHATAARALDWLLKSAPHALPRAT